MAKAKKESIIGLELKKFEEKVKEFQDYLKNNSIITKTDKEGKFVDGVAPDERHKEIDTQIKMMNAVMIWLPALEKLKQTDESKTLDTRGDVPMNPMMKKKLGLE